MSESLIWIALVGLGIVTIALLLLVIKRNRKESREIDYRAFFIMGIIWLPFGIIMEFHFFFILALAYIAIGLANRDKWNKDVGFIRSTKKFPTEKKQEKTPQPKKNNMGAEKTKPGKKSSNKKGGRK